MPSPTILFADFRPQAVAADQRAAFDCFTGRQRDGDALAVILEIRDLAFDFERDEVVALAGFQIGAVDVVAMRHRIGLLEIGFRLIAERHAGDHFAGESAAHGERARPPGIGQDRVLQPDLFQRAEDIRPELDAGADLAEMFGLLQHANRKAFQRQRIGRDQPADAAARDQEWQIPAVSLSHAEPLPICNDL